MQLVTRCPLRAASILWLPKPHAYALTVVCKATFELAPGVSRLAREQEAPFENDVYLDDDEARSLDAASDLVPFKRHPEVIVVGHAHAPQGRAVTSLVARLTIAEVDKAIEVTGDRWVLPDGTLSLPARFTKMPLRWERAAGGADTVNPVGLPMGGEAYPDLHGRIRLPNLAPLGQSIREPHDVVEPAGFAPISPSWPTRAARLHRHAATFRPDAWHVRPLPADVERAYFNAAPLDQGLHELAGTERLILENLHPQHAQLRTRLAPVAPRATVDWGTGEPHDLPLVCDTLLIDADRGLATLTFRGTLALDVPERAGWIVITTDDADELDESATDPAMRPSGGEDLDTAETYAGPVDASGAVLPFLAREAQRQAPTFGAPPLAQGRESAPSFESPPSFGAPTLGQTQEAPVFGSPTLGQTQEAPAVLASARDSVPAFGAAVLASTRDSVPAFGAQVLAAAHEGAPIVGRTIGEIVAEQHAHLSAPPPIPPPKMVEPALDLPRSGEDAAPPPLVGPLAVAEEPAPDEELPTADEDAESADEEEESLPPPSEPPQPKKLPLDVYPLERCARIAARIARRKPDRDDILEVEELESDDWEALSAHWTDLIQEGTARGKTAALDQWDEAYVNELEVERGPITIEEYASLVVAAERNAAESRLTELGLPRGALIRIRRVWGRKLRGDAAFSAKVRAAVEAEADA